MVSMPRLYSIRDECGALTKWNQQVYKQSAQRNTCPTATLSTTNPTWTEVGLKMGLCSAMPATNCLSCYTDRGGTIIWDRLYSIRDECGALTKWNQQVYKQSAQRNTCLTATLSTTNPTWADVGLKMGLRSAMPATNCLSCCTDRGGTTIWDRYPYMAFISGRIRIIYRYSSLWIYKYLIYF